MLLDYLPFASRIRSFVSVVATRGIREITSRPIVDGPAAGDMGMRHSMKCRE